MLNVELSAATINPKLSAIRKLIHEVNRAGVIGAEDIAQITDITNVRQRGIGLVIG